MQHYTRSIEIAEEVEKVYAFHTDPANVVRITPPHVKVWVLKYGPPVAGTEVWLRVRPLPFVYQKWHLRFEVFDPPRRLTDVMVKGPFRYWKQTREFIRLDNGHTLLNDIVEYELPFRGLGRFFNRLLLSRLIDEMYSYRQETTKRILEGQ